MYEVDNKTSGGSVTRTITYYPAAGAMRINSTLYYILKDHLGSASVVTNSSGTVVGEQRYYPFGETRLSRGSIFTDQLFTGQREMTGLGIYHFNARFYSPKLGRFLSADTIVPNPANPQDLNRFSYVRNNPLRYTDPTGNRACGDGERWDCDGRLNPTTPPVVSTPTNTPTSTPTKTPSPTSTSVPTPTGTSTINSAESLIQYSTVGQPLYEYAMNNGFEITYSKNCAGHLAGHTIQVNPCRSAVYVAGNMAHEIMHDLMFHGSTGSQLEEYIAYMVGDAVRAELIHTGYGTSADIDRSLAEYTVNTNNPNKIQLEQDLENWFNNQGLNIYIDPAPAGYGVPPFPLTFTPRPTITTTP